MIFSKNKAILVTGGAGYIGSHVAYELYKQGYFVIIVDTFYHKQTIPTNWGLVIKEDIGNRSFLDKLFSTYTIDAVIHLAGFIEVFESVIDPARFYHNNITKSLQLLDAMKEHRVSRCVFSSSCAVYGHPQQLPLQEDHPLHPENPYGKTKLAVEYALHDYAQAYNIQVVALRYFNAAGAIPEAHIGEQHDHETHIIPLLLRAGMAEQEFFIFGDDYATEDGTCIRDYIHVKDLAQAHIKAYDFLCAEQGSSHGLYEVFNVGSGSGFSVKELVKEAERVVGRSIRTTIKPRRAGDAPVLVADTRKIEQQLKWRAAYSDLAAIMLSAYSWELDQQRRKMPLVGSEKKARVAL